jgi:hypothetical protein
LADLALAPPDPRLDQQAEHELKALRAEGEKALGANR